MFLLFRPRPTLTRFALEMLLMLAIGLSALLAVASALSNHSGVWSLLFLAGLLAQHFLVRHQLVWVPFWHRYEYRAEPDERLEVRELRPMPRDQSLRSWVDDAICRRTHADHDVLLLDSLASGRVEDIALAVADELTWSHLVYRIPAHALRKQMAKGDRALLTLCQAAFAACHSRSGTALLVLGATLADAPILQALQAALQRTRLSCHVRICITASNAEVLATQLLGPCRVIRPQVPSSRVREASYTADPPARH